MQGQRGPRIQGQRVLVTGGAGFIGSNLANHLVTDNDVIVVDDCSIGTPKNLDSAVEFHERSVIEDDLPTDVDVVFSLAARSSSPMHTSNPQRGARVDVEGFVNVVQQARQDGCETVVYASTSSVYGTQAEPVSEEADVSAGTEYEAATLSRERYAESVSNQYGMSLAGLRLFSVYQGYGGKESHKGEFANVISQFADDIANGQQPILYGDGTQTRDFVHVSDVVRAMELAADAALDGIHNVGTGTRHSFNAVVDAINDELGTTIEPAYVENPISESVYVHDTCADASKLRETTGWDPEIGVRKGIETVCAPY